MPQHFIHTYHLRCPTVRCVPPPLPFTVDFLGHVTLPTYGKFVGDRCYRFVDFYVTDFTLPYSPVSFHYVHRVTAIYTLPVRYRYIGHSALRSFHHSCTCAFLPATLFYPPLFTFHSPHRFRWLPVTTTACVHSFCRCSPFIPAISTDTFVFTCARSPTSRYAWLAIYRSLAIHYTSVRSHTFPLDSLPAVVPFSRCVLPERSATHSTLHLPHRTVPFCSPVVRYFTTTILESGSSST